MTAGSLEAVLAWDVPRLRGEVRRLDEVAGTLPGWRFRVEDVGRSLETAPCWSGPAARSAATAVVQLSGVATVVAAGLARSVGALQQLAAEALSAREQAQRALALRATATTVHGTEAAAVVAACEAAAAEHAAAAGAAARRAGELLAGLGVVDAFAPADFAGLADLLGPQDAVPAVPGTAGPSAVARWWAGLAEGARDAVITADPGAIGRLDGVPAWARDRANRRVLDRLLGRRDPAAQVAAAVATELDAEAANGRSAQLYAFDPRAGTVAVAFGDVDSADAVALVVPGIRTTVAAGLPGLARRTRDVAAAADAAAPGLTVAGIAWLGYRTPQHLAEIVTRGDARRGGRQLDDTLEGLAAARAASGRGPARTTVVAHSYGTVVVDAAADLPGRLPVDAVVLLGSPGMEVPGALRTEVPEVYDAAAALDPVSWVAWFGADTWAGAYDAVELPADWTTLHWQYFDSGRPTLRAMGQVVAGREVRG